MSTKSKTKRRPQTPKTARFDKAFEKAMKSLGPVQQPKSR